MKKRINLSVSVFILSACLLMIGCKSQELSFEDQAAMATLSKIIEAQKYNFVATVAIPGDMSADFSTYNLTSRYTLDVSKDSLRANLPYMGKVYQAVPGMGAQGIDFLSKNYKHEIKIKKKTIQVDFIPLDMHNVKYLTMTIFLNRTATLNIQERSRQPMSFNGIIEW